MYFVDINKAFERIPQKAMWKKSLTEVIVRAVMSPYHGAKMKVGVGSKLSRKSLVQGGVHQGSMLLSMLLAIVLNVIENAREGLMNEIL